jgi:dihydrofolate synthase/folylpolyglutamate synthase
MMQVFDVFQWISSFPRFGTAPSPDLLAQVERQTRTAGGANGDVDVRAQKVFRNYGMRPGLERMQAMLERLGNPHHALRFVHIAGTNGKGSTAAFLASLFQQAGFRTGLYTSPYLTQFHDRMSVNGVQVTTEQLTRYAMRLKPVVEDVMAGPAGIPTEFEVVTVLAILFFSDLAVNVIVWETGLGGRLDSTNVVSPVATIITNIGLEHTEILGDTVEKIAREKAGIIKPGVPVFTAATDEALRVIAETARLHDSPLSIYGRDFWMVREQADETGQRCLFRCRDPRLFLDVFGIEMRMHGNHQLQNAALAIATFQWCIRHAGLIREERCESPHWSQSLCNTVRIGIRKMHWAGRFEVINRQPLWILDGAHNPHGVKALAATLEEWQRRKPRRLLLLLGVLRDKDLDAMLRLILPFVSGVVATQPDTPRALAAEQLAAHIKGIWHGRVLTATTVPAAIRAALQLSQGSDPSYDGIVCMGSLYTISEARHVLLHHLHELPYAVQP